MNAEEFINGYNRLMLTTPRLALNNTKSINSEYCTWSINNKNCYMCHAADHNEDCMWSRWLYFSKDCTDCSFTHKSILCYDCVDIVNCYNCDHCQDCDNSVDCEFCYDCVGCNNCIGCAGLRRQEFCIFNKKYPQAEYFEKKSQFHQVLKSNPQAVFQAVTNVQSKTPRKAVHSFNSENCTGDHIYNSKNCHDCYDINDSQDCGHLYEAVEQICDCYDIFALEQAELCYEGVSNWGYNMNFCVMCWFSSDMEYCDTCQSCKNCFGCISLKNKKYCILNKQYTKEEYEQITKEIKDDMRAKNLYGRWFPQSPFKIEDTLATD